MNPQIKKLVAIIILSSFFSTNLCLASAEPRQYSDNIEAQLEQILQDSQTQTQAAETDNNAIIKAGENFAIELIDPIESQNAKQGDDVSAKLLFPIEINDEVIIPEGSIVKGKIKKLSQNSGWFKNASAEIEFNKIEGRDDYELPIIAKIKTKDDSGILLGASGVERFGKVFSALSTISLGSAIAGLGIGLVSSYALVGAAIGFTLGATISSGWLFFQKGQPIEIPSGTKLLITLQNDVAVSGFEI